MPSRRSPHAAVMIALLLLPGSAAWAGSAERPIRHRASTGSTPGEGVYGLTMLRVHGGLSAPSGDFGDLAESGWTLGCSVAHGVSRQVLMSAALSYHAYDRRPGFGDYAVTPLTMDVDAVFPTRGSVHPWVGGGLGIYHVDWKRNVTVLIGGLPYVASRSDSETDLGLNMGAGLGGPLGPRTLWGVGFRFHHLFEGDLVPTSLDFFTFQFGIGYRLGSS
jgi:opacity protein-like surface antigen